MKLATFEDQMFFSTVRITVPGRSGIGASIGTGFLIRCPLNDNENRSSILLVSNRHVFVDPKKSIVLNFHKAKTDVSAPDLGQIVTIQHQEFEGIYEGHPDPEIDLACINVSAITQHKVYCKTLNPSWLCDFTEDSLLPGLGVWFIGYPENRFDTTHNLPILRRGYIASIPTIDFNAKKQFVIDAQVFPGSSGSPVFATFGQDFKLLGVVSETMIRNEKLQMVPSSIPLGVQQFLGLGIVIKATALKDLIDHAIQQIKNKLEKREPEPTT